MDRLQRRLRRQPRRLPGLPCRKRAAAHTWHPSPDTVRGWTPDGKRVLFSSSRGFETTQDQLYTTTMEGGFPSQLPLPSAESRSFSPDGTHLAYVPHLVFEPNWKRYQGGQTTPIWIADLKDSSVVAIP